MMMCLGIIRGPDTVHYQLHVELLLRNQLWKQISCKLLFQKGSEYM